MSEPIGRPILRRSALSLGLGAAAAVNTPVLAASPSGPPRAIVLVHGAWHGGWCWQRVVARLTRRGHAVFAPTLTGLCERSHLASPQVNLTTHIEDVANLLRWERLTNVVLVGHSYAGMVVSGVTERAAPGVIGSLVLLDAFLPDHDKSVIDYQQPNAEGERTGFVKPPPAERFNVNPADRAWVDSLCTPQPYKTMTERVQLSGARERIADRTYIKASRYSGMTLFGQRAKADKAWRYTEIACGHDVMIDEPEILSGLLDKIAVTGG